MEQYNMEYNVFWSSFPDIKLVNISSLSTGCLFLCGLFSLSCRRFFGFDVISLLCFYFCCCAFGVIFKKSFPRPVTWFLLIDLQCQVLPTNDFNPFWVDVWVWCRIRVQRISIFPQHYLLKRLSFSYCAVLADVLKIN